MSDTADFAAELQEAEITARLSRIDTAIPAGVAGECEECGETMPRLVAGRCGYCRDGRRPPLERYAELPRAAALPSPTKEHAEMTLPKTDDRHTISVPMEGALLAWVKDYAADKGLPLGRSVIDLLTAGYDAIGAAVDAEAQAKLPTVVDLSAVPAEWLAEEITRRLAAGADRSDLDAERARADAEHARAQAAEEQLARVRDLILSAA